MSLASWLVSLIEGAVRWALQEVVHVVLQALIALLSAIPVPAFVNDIGSAFGGLPSSVVFFASIFHVAYGVGVCVSAWLLRFALRRVPLIGG